MVCTSGVGRVRLRANQVTEEQREANRQSCKRWYRNNLQKAKAARQAYAAENWGRYAIREVRRRSESKNLKCTITADWLNEKFEPMICEATGLRLIWDGPAKGNPWAPSVDRIDPSKGYTEDNTQITCWAYNWAKGNWSHDVLSIVAHAIVEKEKSNGQGFN